MAAACRSPANARPPNGPAPPTCSSASTAATPARSSRPSAISSGWRSLQRSMLRWPMPRSPARHDHSLDRGHRRRAACQDPGRPRLSGHLGAAGHRLSRLTRLRLALQTKRARGIAASPSSFASAARGGERTSSDASTGACSFRTSCTCRRRRPSSSLSSARISRLLFGFCRLFLRMWSHTFDTTSLRGSGPNPQSAASSADGVTGRASPPPALRPVPFAIWPSCCSGRDRARIPPLCKRGKG